MPCTHTKKIRVSARNSHCKSVRSLPPQSQVRCVRDPIAPDRARRRDDAHVQSDRNGTDLRRQVGVAQLGPMYRPYSVVETAGKFIEQIASVQTNYYVTSTNSCRYTHPHTSSIDTSHGISFPRNLVSTQSVMFYFRARVHAFTHTHI